MGNLEPPKSASELAVAVINSEFGSDAGHRAAKVSGICLIISAIDVLLLRLMSPVFDNSLPKFMIIFIVPLTLVGFMSGAASTYAMFRVHSSRQLALQIVSGAALIVFGAMVAWVFLLVLAFLFADPNLD